MNQGFQSSFIPKGVAGEESAKKKTTSVAEMLAISIFVLTVLASAGLFVYKSMLKSGIEDSRIQLVNAGQTIDKVRIEEMSSFSRKMNRINSIVDKHQVISGFISSLASSTIRTVYFNDFDYNIVQGELNVDMQGSADSYGAVALQEDFFKVSVSVDPEIVTYAPFIEETEQGVDLQDSELEAMEDLGNLEDLDGIEASLNGI